MKTTDNKQISKTRFDARLSKEQKEFFEYAASLGGFRTLTEFIIYTVQEKAKKIIDAHNTVLASQKDKELFFNALLHPATPNKKLQQAALKHKEAVKKK